MTREEQREAAHKAAEAALHDMKEQLAPEQVEDGYDLEELSNGDIKITCGHDVVLYVDLDGEVQYDSPADPPFQGNWKEAW